ncbi:type VII secretion system-associated protein, partial [Streptomyces sp. NPDC060031]|uniref:type VII secretion system-associated protein n=1 Tax=Streptomyces sp. NPDC060031 TaxID=3347043 RepID=UPI0036CC2FD4
RTPVAAAGAAPLPGQEYVIKSNLTHLDAQSLQDFQEKDVADFHALLVAMAQDQGTGADQVMSMKHVSDYLRDTDLTVPDPPLTIGFMGRADKGVAGHQMRANTQKAAEAISLVLEGQERLFGKMGTDLKQTWEKLKNTQGSSLESIESSEFIQIMDLVDGELTSQAPPKPPPVIVTPP